MKTGSKFVPAPSHNCTKISQTRHKEQKSSANWMKISFQYEKDLFTHFFSFH